VSMEMLELLRLWLVVEELDLRDPPLIVSLDELVKLELPLRDDLLMLDPEPMLRPLTLLDESSDIVRSLLLEPEMLRPLVVLLLLMLEALVTLEMLKLALVTLDELVRLDGLDDLDDLDGLDDLDDLDDADKLAADLRLLVGLKGGLAPSLCS
jgi:hypothetical protein